MEKLKSRLEANFRAALKKDSVSSLGDRSTYIGASDISGCLRAAYLNKTSKREEDIKQLLIFERGHAFENIVEKFFYGMTYKKQVEIKGAKTSNGFPLKPHLDFVLYDKAAKTATVVEAKSTKGEITLYDSYVFQLQLQMGLLQAQCGSDWKVNGFVFVLNMEGEYNTYFQEQSKTLFDMQLQKADVLADALKKRKEPLGEPQLYCSSCPFKEDCPAISKGVDVQLPMNMKLKIRELQKLKDTERKIKSLKETVKGFMEATNVNVAKCDNSTVSLVRGKGDAYKLDVNLLRIEQPEVYAKYRKPENGSTWLKII
jgi:CRISPR-associated exonuclease Cas4